jgi:prepilin-type N-terminal cleavage/methylation domain-containing protein
MGILGKKRVKELHMIMGIKRKKGFSLVEVIIATSIITFIIFAVMEVYYVNKKAEEQNQISYIIDESISEIVPVELLRIPANVSNENNPAQVAQELVTHLNGMEDSIKGEINNDLKNFDKQSEIKDINFSYITERKNENSIVKDSQNKAVKTYIKVEYSYKTKYSTRKKIIKLPVYSYYYRPLFNGLQPPFFNTRPVEPRDSVSLAVDGD